MISVSLSTATPRTNTKAGSQGLWGLTLEHSMVSGGTNTFTTRTHGDWGLLGRKSLVGFLGGGGNASAITLPVMDRGTEDKGRPVTGCTRVKSGERRVPRQCLGSRGLNAPESSRQKCSAFVVQSSETGAKRRVGWAAGKAAGGARWGGLRTQQRTQQSHSHTFTLPRDRGIGVGNMKEKDEWDGDSTNFRSIIENLLTKGKKDLWLPNLITHCMHPMHPHPLAQLRDRGIGGKGKEGEFCRNICLGKTSYKLLVINRWLPNRHGRWHDWWGRLRCQVIRSWLGKRWCTPLIRRKVRIDVTLAHEQLRSNFKVELRWLPLTGPILM